MVHPMNHIWRISNLHCALSMLWFTLRTIFSELVIYAVNFLHVISLNLYGISINYHFLSYMVRPTKSLASLGLAEVRPNHGICAFPCTKFKFPNAYINLPVNQIKHHHVSPLYIVYFYLSKLSYVVKFKTYLHLWCIRR